MVRRDADGGSYKGVLSSGSKERGLERSQCRNMFKVAASGRDEAIAIFAEALFF